MLGIAFAPQAPRHEVVIGGVYVLVFLLNFWALHLVKRAQDVHRYCNECGKGKWSYPTLLTIVGMLIEALLSGALGLATLARRLGVSAVATDGDSRSLDRAVLGRRRHVGDRGDDVPRSSASQMG